MIKRRRSGWASAVCCLVLVACDTENPNAVGDGGITEDAGAGGGDGAVGAGGGGGDGGAGGANDLGLDAGQPADGSVDFDEGVPPDGGPADRGLDDDATLDGAVDGRIPADGAVDGAIDGAVDGALDAALDAEIDMAPVMLCPDGTPAEPEACDGADNDCDGAIDEGFGLAERCEGIGRCGVGFTECDGAGGTRCSTNPGGSTDQSAEERCNAVDDDCDGIVDEGDFGAACYDGPDGTAGVGTCQGGFTGCMDGREGVCVGQVLPEAERCDGRDEDCDGIVDEGFEVVAACGAGVCRETATPSACVDGEARPCQPGPPQGDDSDCNGRDDDCDGLVDEDFSVEAACGVGRCRALSRPGECVNGAARACEPGPAEAIDARCDGVDEDCDGNTDEEFVARGCGVGVCARDAIPSACVDGVPRECTPGEPVDADDNCDGLDGDCDGRIDEGYQPNGVCGVGACGIATTPSRCVDGVERPCEPGAPIGDDATCDGLDDDCDGATDEAYQVTVECGQGVCRAASTASACVDGVEQRCMPGPPGPSDDDCDGLDQDCDGVVDEAVPGRIGDEVALTATGLGAAQPDIARNGALGGVVWSDARDGGAELYYQRLDAAGAPVGGAVRLGLIGGNKSRPSIAPDGAGGFGIAWQNTRTGRAQIHFARIDAAGAVVRADLRVVNHRANAFGAQLAFNGAEFGLTWTDQRDAIPQIWFQRLDAAGELIGEAVQVTVGEAPASVPAIAAAPRGWAVAFNLDSQRDFDVFVQRLDADGSRLGEPQQVSAGDGNANAPRIVPTGAGFTAVWYDTRDDNTEIYAARLDANGARVGAEVRVSDDPRSSFLVDVVAAGDGFGVAWTDRRAGNDEVWFQRLAADATPFGPPYRVSEGPRASFSPALAWHDGIFDVVWYDARDGEDEIYYARGAFGCAP